VYSTTRTQHLTKSQQAMCIRIVKVKIATMLFLLTWIVSVAEATGPTKVVKVWVECSCDDMIGNRVYSAVKEKIRESRGFRLASLEEADRDPAGFAIHIISLNVQSGEENESSALSVAFTAPMMDHTELYYTSLVMIVGSDKVSEMADSIFAHLDSETEGLQR
jgi:hypothetical protein